VTHRRHRRYEPAPQLCRQTRRGRSSARQDLARILSVRKFQQLVGGAVAICCPATPLPRSEATVLI
jgi:hypothetical protein